MSSVQQQQQLQRPLKECLHRLETLATDSESASSASYSSTEEDSAAEKAYWADLLHKAIHQEGTHPEEAASSDGDVSLTQEESDSELSSAFYNWHSEIEASTLTEVEPHLLPPKRKHHHHHHHSKEKGNSPLRMVPFVSLNVQWQQQHHHDDYDYEETDRAQAEPILIEEMSNKGEDDHNGGIWTPRVVQTTERDHVYYCRSTTSVPAHVIIHEDDHHRQEIMEILDPTEPLIYGELGVAHHHHCLESDLTTRHAHEMYQLLQEHLENMQCETIQSKLMDLMERVPETCQIRYPLVHEQGQDGDDETTFLASSCYPITFFCRTDSLACLKVAYRSFPEAVGNMVTSLGMPLHYACHYGASFDTIEFLLSVFIDASRQLNAQQQTPLHVAILGSQQHNHTDTKKNYPQVIQVLADAYPAAAQIPDCDGFTPLHSACRYHDATSSHAKDLLTILLPTTCPVMATSNDSQKPLHVAAAAAAAATASRARQGTPNTFWMEVLQLLVEHEPAQVRYTDDCFQTPLHKAVESYCRFYKDVMDSSLEPLQYLANLFPAALDMSDVHDECPWDTAIRILGREQGPPELWSLLSSTRDDEDKP